MNFIYSFDVLIMEIEFNNQELEDLYEGKKVKNKIFKSNPQLVSQFIKVVGKLYSAPQIEDLYQITSLNYEALSGDRKGQSSVRINEKYRLIFVEIREEKEPFGVKIILIEEITNHYSA